MSEWTPVYCDQCGRTMPLSVADDPDTHACATPTETKETQR